MLMSHLVTTDYFRYRCLVSGLGERLTARQVALRQSVNMVVPVAASIHSSLCEICPPPNEPHLNRARQFSLAAISRARRIVADRVDRTLEGQKR